MWNFLIIFLYLYLNDYNFIKKIDSISDDRDFDMNFFFIRNKNFVYRNEFCNEIFCLGEIATKFKVDDYFHIQPKSSFETKLLCSSVHSHKYPSLTFDNTINYVERELQEKNVQFSYCLMKCNKYLYCACESIPFMHDVIKIKCFISNKTSK